MGKNTARYWIVEHLFNGVIYVIASQFSQVRGFPLPEYLEALVGERIKEARQGKPRPVNIRRVYKANEPLAPSDTSQVKRVLFLQIQIDHIQNGKPRFSHSSHHRTLSLPLQYFNRGLDCFAALLYFKKAMFSAEVRAMLFQVITSWQVLAVTIVIILYIFLVNYVAREYHRRPKKKKAPPKKKVEKTEEAVVTDDDELGLEET